MQNKVWEQVGCFLNKLRCENVTRDTAVEVPGYRDTQQELEEMRETCEEIVRSLPEDQWQTLLEWMAKLEDMNSMEGAEGILPRICRLHPSIKRSGTFPAGDISRGID